MLTIILLFHVFVDVNGFVITLMLLLLIITKTSTFINCCHTSAIIIVGTIKRICENKIGITQVVRIVTPKVKKEHTDVSTAPEEVTHLLMFQF